MATRMLAVALLALAAGCDASGPNDPAIGCARSGGTVSTAQCCALAQEFPNTCLVGACGCSPENSATRTVCLCPAGTCFDGNACR
jgi:hypothetical protein